MKFLIDEILSAIEANNTPVKIGRGLTQFENTRRDGRVEAYEHVLKLLGFYDDEGQPRFRLTDDTIQKERTPSFVEFTSPGDKTVRVVAGRVGSGLVFFTISINEQVVDPARMEWRRAFACLCKFGVTNPESTLRTAMDRISTAK